MSDLRKYADRTSLLNRLERLSVGACDCAIKSPEVRYHQRGCPYRIYQEAVILLKADRSASDALDQKSADFQALCDENEKEIETNCELRVRVERLEAALRWEAGDACTTDYDLPCLDEMPGSPDLWCRYCRIENVLETASEPREQIIKRGSPDAWVPRQTVGGTGDG